MCVMLAALACQEGQPTGPQPPPPRAVAFGICASGESETFASGPDWAQSRCTAAPPNIRADANGFAINWRDAVSFTLDGLSQAAFCISGGDWACGRLRWNHDPAAYSAVVALNAGGGGVGWPEAPRDGGAGDNTDWRSLEAEHAMRIVGVRWRDTGINYRGGGAPAGRFTRQSAAPASFGAMAERTRLTWEWIDRELNAAGRPLALLGSSGGADAVLSALRGPLKDKVKYLAPVSYPPPFWDPLAACNPGAAPANTMVDPETGEVGTFGTGPNPPSGAPLVDGVLATPNDDCLHGTLTPAQAAGSSTREAFDAILANRSGYTGTLHLLVGTRSGPDSDITNGVVWAAGNLGAHPFFSGARRVWYQSPTEWHGEPFTNVNGPGFTHVYNELVAMARGN